MFVNIYSLLFIQFSACRSYQPENKLADDWDNDGYSEFDGDCDDADSSLTPEDKDGDGQSTCDGDCIDLDPFTFSGIAYREQELLCMRDADGDGYGDYEPPAGAQAGSDCNDSNDNINPDVSEVCDGVDNNCDGTIDEELLNTYYVDADGDGYGDADISVTACDIPEGYVELGEDCNDADSTKYPGALVQCEKQNTTFCSGGGKVSGDVYQGVFCVSPADVVSTGPSTGDSFIWHPGPITNIAQ